MSLYDFFENAMWFLIGTGFGVLFKKPLGLLMGWIVDLISKGRKT